MSVFNDKLIMMSYRELQKKKKKKCNRVWAGCGVRARVYDRGKTHSPNL